MKIFNKKDGFVNEKRKKQSPLLVPVFVLTVMNVWYVTILEAKELRHDYLKALAIVEVVQSRGDVVRTFEVISPAVAQQLDETIVDDEQTATLGGYGAKESAIDNPLADSEGIDAIVSAIYTLESSRGKNNYSKCEVQGKYNGYGYGIAGNGKYLCFDSHEEATATVHKWVEKKIAKGYTTQELLCIYNTGSSKDCGYYQKYLSII